MFNSTFTSPFQRKPLVECIRFLKLKQISLNVVLPTKHKSLNGFFM